jgi:hypothetical protein
MEGKAIAFWRISKPEYNKDWYEKNQLYMNAQTRFHDTSLKSGQADIEEGLISTIPMQIWTGVEQSVNLGQITSIAHDANAYIFYVYCIMGYDLRVDKKTGFYTHIIPWKGYIENFWEDGILCAKNEFKSRNTFLFIEIRKRCVCRIGISECSIR